MNGADFGKEWALLVAASHCDENRAEKDCRALLDRGGVDWEAFITLAARHRLYPLAYLRFKNLTPLSVPDRSLERLRQLYMKNMTRNLFLSRVLVKILDVCESHGIPILLFKGPVLSEQLYGDIGARVFSDLDLLVSENDAVTLRGLLLDQGYTCDPDLRPGQIAGYQKRENFFSLKGPDGSVSLDLHWELSGRYAMKPMPFSQCTKEGARVLFENRQIRSMTIESLLIYLCIHHSSHGWDHLEQVTNVAALLFQHPGMDTSRLVAQARALGALRMLLVGCCLARTLYAIRLPEALAVRIEADARVRTLTAVLCRSLGRAPAAGLPWRFSWTHLKLRDSRLDAFLYGLRLVFRPTVKEWMTMPLPSYLTFLYPVLRPFRLLRLYGHFRNTGQ